MNLLEFLKSGMVKPDTIISSLFISEEISNRTRVSIGQAINFSKHGLHVLHLTELKDIDFLAGLYLEKLTGKPQSSKADISGFEDILKNIDIESCPIRMESLNSIKISDRTNIILLDGIISDAAKFNELRDFAMKNGVAVMTASQDTKKYPPDYKNKKTFGQVDFPDVTFARIGNIPAF